MSGGRPTGWASTRVSDLFAIHGGGTPNRATSAYWNGGIPWLSSGDIKATRIRESSETITRRGLEESAARLCRKGSVVIVVRSGILKHTLPVALLEREAAINQDLKAFDSGDEQLNSWLALAWRANARELLANNREGTTVQSVKLQTLQEFELPIPPSAEQGKILEKVEKLSGKVEACQERLTRIPILLKRFRQSVLAAACSGRLTTDWREENPATESASDLLAKIAALLKDVKRAAEPSQNGDFDYSLLTTNALPESWAISRLSLCFEEIKNGTTAAQNSEGKGHPVTRIETIQNFRFDMRRIRYTEELDADELADFRYQPGDIAFSHINSFEHVGKTALYSGEPPVLVHGMNLLRLRLGHKFLNSHFAHLFMRTDFFRNEVRMRVGHAVNQVSINQKNLAQVPLVVAPIAEQQEIVRRVEALFALADQIEARYAKAKAYVDKITPSLLGRAFRGELVPQDPNDEPAEALLSRIHQQRKNGKKP